MSDVDTDRMQDARKSFTGKRLTSSQFDESWAIAGVMEREIRTSGSFIEKLTDYAHVFARSQKFDALKGESIIRDIFAARYGQTMNKMREGLMQREATLKENGQDQALHYAQSIGWMIVEGETMPFFSAYDEAATAMAIQHSISETGAKELMKEAYAQAEGRELYDAFKELEQQFHRPKQEAKSTERRKLRGQMESKAPERHM